MKMRIAVLFTVALCLRGATASELEAARGRHGVVERVATAPFFDRIYRMDRIPRSHFRTDCKILSIP